MSNITNIHKDFFPLSPTDIQQEKQCTYNVTMRRVHVIIFCSGKAISITYFKCLLLALGIHHAMRVRHIVICGLSGCFFTLS